jgi:hypothetical protein
MNSNQSSETTAAPLLPSEADPPATGDDGEDSVPVAPTVDSVLTSQTPLANIPLVTPDAAPHVGMFLEHGHP